MSTPPRHYRLLLVSALAILAFAMTQVRGAASWYGRPFASILVDPDGQVSSFGLPTWDGFQQGLRYPDQVLEIDGEPLRVLPGGRYRADVWDRAVDTAARLGHPTVHVLVQTSRDGDRRREVDLGISRLEPLAFWLVGGVPIGTALLYVAGAMIALAASPRGRLARTFAKATLFAALFLFTLFDYHTTRAWVPLFDLAFAMVPMAAFALPLRLPDDVPLLRRRPWIVGLLDALGLSLGAGMIGAHLLGGTTAVLRGVCTVLFAASFLFFAVTFVVRFVRAEGDRRASMRALVVAMVPPHVILGATFLLTSLSLDRATQASTGLLAVSALALTPLSSVVALIRHDLWGSRALLSRVLVRVVIVAVTCAAAIALGTGVAALFDVRIGGALLAAGVAGLAASLLVGPALRVGDQALFPSRAVYKPSVAELSEELTVVAVPEEVGHAVELTVRRWLQCERVEFRLTGGHAELAGEERTGVSSVRLLKPGRSSAAPPATPSSPPPSFPAARASAPPDPGGGDELAIDVLFRGTPLAELRVGKKGGGALFTSEDVDLLQTIANQAALALAHAYSYAELEQRRRQQAAAWRDEREALIETVAAEIAHEVRYPINFFRSIFRRGQSDLRLDAEDVDIGCDEVERLERLVSGLRRVVTRRLERQRVTASELVLKAERLLRDQLGRRSVEADVGDAVLRCDSDQVTQVLVNLLSNAFDAAGEDGRVGVEWTSGPHGGVLTVWDTGPGFEGDPSRVFAPWYTTKPRGTGLGLAITHRIVRAHGWTIEPERRDGRTLFVIGIPASDVAHGAGGGRGMEVA